MLGLIVGTAANGENRAQQNHSVHPGPRNAGHRNASHERHRAVAIRKRYPKLPVIMFSTLTERGAVTTWTLWLRAPATTSPSPAIRGVWTRLAFEFRKSYCPRSKRCAPRAHRENLRRLLSFQISSTEPRYVASSTLPSRSLRLALQRVDRTRWPRCCRSFPPIFPFRW